MFCEPVNASIAACWAIELGVDGFRFDLGITLSRGENLLPLDKPPLFEGRNIYMILAPVINTDKSVKTKELNSAQT